MNQPHSSRGRTGSANPSPDATIRAPSGGVRAQPGSLVASTANNSGYQLNAFPSVEHYYYGGYDSNTGSWSGFLQYASADGPQVVPPVIYGDNTALGLHSLYGFNSQMTYGQYSPVSTPVPPVVVDSQLFAPQQIPFSPSYHAQAGATSMPHISTPLRVSQDLTNFVGNHPVDSGSNASFYNLRGTFGPGEPLSTPNPIDLSRRAISPLTSAGAYAQPMGTYGSYDPNVAQASQRSPVSAYGLSSGFFPSQYAYDISTQSTSFACLPSPQQPFGYPSQLYLEKGRNRREQVPGIVVSSDRNRGPRALKVKGKSNVEDDAVFGPSKVVASSSAPKYESFNRPDFPTEPDNARCFIIKSFSEDNVHKSIKYGVWASTLHGNKKLDDAYWEVKGSENCPVYLFFSVNASSQFCGVAEMAGPVDFEKNADYWQQDRWIGQFPVTWHILKDVPNSKFCHIILENNDNKPVTHSRDSQEVKLEQGREMLEIFKEHEASTSILDDFDFYDERERVLQERKNRLVAKPNTETPELDNAAGVVDDQSERLDQALELEDSTK